jgi:iron complex outermembrane receptor protein
MVQPARAGATPTVEELSRLSIEELANIEVTSVFKRPSPLAKSPAAIYVITSEDIRRSGVTSLPEALRLAPNLEVAQLNASSQFNTSPYAISARGFNSNNASNKLLVLIDGRSIYSPLHSGVFWDASTVMLEDVDSIEVISGPGGSLYGVNAVNGVINIITKSAIDTQGGLASAQLGTVDRTGAVRYGGKLGNDGAYRVYGLGFQRGHTVHADGTSAGDDWGGMQGGFRTDWRAESNTFTVQGDAYRDPLHVGGAMSGANLLGRWKHALSKDSAVELQTYYDTADRSFAFVSDSLETFDVQVQHSFSPSYRQKFVWGGGYRSTDDEFINNLNAFTLVPTSRTLRIGNLFAQDTIAVLDRVDLTLGLKLEHSSYSGLEYMPEARVGWSVTDTDFLWTAVSRAVRTPNRIERELQFPGILSQAPDFQSEKLISYEAGYRGQFSTRASASVSLYYNQYDDLRTTEFTNGGLPLQLGNGIEGHTYGMEAWADYRLRPWWRLKPGLNLVRKNLHVKPGHTDASGTEVAGNDPQYQIFLRSSMDITKDIDFDVSFRTIDELMHPSIPSYSAVDARIGWRVTDALELSLAAFNIFDDHHPETGGAPLSEIRRTVYAGARWRF